MNELLGRLLKRSLLENLKYLRTLTVLGPHLIKVPRNAFALELRELAGDLSISLVPSPINLTPKVLASEAALRDPSGIFREVRKAVNHAISSHGTGNERRCG